MAKTMGQQHTPLNSLISSPTTERTVTRLPTAALGRCGGAEPPTAGVEMSEMSSPGRTTGEASKEESTYISVSNDIGYELASMLEY